MATRYGKCTNIGNCSNADSKKVIEILDGQEFECPECQNELFQIQGGKSGGGINPKKLIILAIPIVLIGLFFLLKPLFSTDSKETTDEPVVKTEEVSDGNSKDEYILIKQNGIVRIGVQADAPPLNYYDRNNRPKGLDYEICKLIFSQTEFALPNTGVQMKYDATSYDEILPLLRKKDGASYSIDLVMGGLTYIDGDETDIIFTEPYLENMGYSLISRNDDGINTIRDLKGKRIGVVKEDPDVLEFAKKLLGSDARIVELSDEEDAWMQLNYDNKSCDAFIYDFPFAATELENNPRGNLKIKISNLPGSNLQYRIGLRRGNELLRSKLNAAIARIKETPEYANQLKMYLPVKNVARFTNTQNLPTHTVQRGETLSIIARNKLGNMDRWIEIQNLNNIPNPHLINVGDVLMIPNK